MVLNMAQTSTSTVDDYMAKSVRSRIESKSERPPSSSINVPKTVTAVDSHVSHSKQVLDILFCVSGIYVSFITWAVLQERISTTPYGNEQKLFDGSLVINTIQSFFAAIVGYIYVQYKESSTPSVASGAVLSDPKVWQNFALVATCQSISSPFAYASLKYVNYITLLLAKSCKLLPVMAIHLTLYRKQFPLYKYVVVCTITLGVFLFTYCKSHPKSHSPDTSSTSLIGLGLLSVNLLLDGVTNSTQDHIFHTDKRITGPHMMCGINAISTVLTSLFLLSPFSNQLATSLAFIHEHPAVLKDIVLFGLCGALGQVFIFYTLGKYGSMILVTVTVTRKMFSMLLSVVWFNHSLSFGQWIGVLAVFGAIGSEAYIKYLESKNKQKKL